MSASPEHEQDTAPENATATLRELNVSDVEPNAQNPRLDFPQGELDKLTDSIDLEGCLSRLLYTRRVTSSSLSTVNAGSAALVTLATARSRPSLRMNAVSAKCSSRCSTFT